MTIVWLDGCYDSFHFAHANGVLQSRSLVPNAQIFVGVHSDAEISKNKGPPLFNERERYDLIRSCRWVAQVIENVPYITEIGVIDKFNVDFVAHGDDPVMDADGNDCYAFVKAVGRYKEFKRTEGISTTSLITRLLNPTAPIISSNNLEQNLLTLLRSFCAAAEPPLPFIDFGADPSAMSTTIRQRALRESKRVIYISGSWDCFGSGHAELLRRAKNCVGEEGLLIAGVWSDEVIHEGTGERPLLKMLERSLALAQCKHVDGLILSTPRLLPQEMISKLSLDIIVNPPIGQEIGPLSAIQVEEPQLQSIPLLRARVEARQSEYAERQKRKGG